MAGEEAGVPRRVRVLRLAGAVTFALTPWVTLGFGTAVAFAVVALLFGRLGRVHAVVLWSSTAVYTVMLVVGFAQSDSVEGSSGDVVFTACVLVSMVVGGLEALALNVVAIVSGYRVAFVRNRIPLPGDGPPVHAAVREPSARQVRPGRGRSGSRVERIVSWVFAVVSVGFLTPMVVVGLLYGVSFRNHHRDALATVVSVRKETHCTGAPVPSCTDQYYPTVRFAPAGGRIVQEETGDFRGDNRAFIAVGRRLVVHYDPGDPRDVRLGTGWDSQDTVLVVLIVFIDVMVVVIAVQARRDRSRRLIRRAAFPPTDSGTRA